MSFESRWTPIPAADNGFQTITPTGSVISQNLLVALPFGLPEGAGAAIMQGSASTFRFLVYPLSVGGVGSLYPQGTTQVLLRNIEQIRNCWISRRFATVNIQFFTGRVGSAY